MSDCTQPETRTLSASAVVVAQYQQLQEFWCPISTMLEPRSFFGQCVFEGKVIVTGGFDCRGTKLSSVECYDPTSGVWTSLPPMPSASSQHLACTINGAVYDFSVGSVRGTADVGDRIHVLDMNSQTWSEVTTIPRRYSFATTVFTDNTGGVLSFETKDMGMFVLAPDTIENHDMVHDASNASWRTLHCMLTCRYDSTWLFGARNGSFHTSKHDGPIVYKHDGDNGSDVALNEM